MHGEMINPLINLVGKKAKRSHGRPGPSWDDNIKMDMLLETQVVC